MIQKIKEYISKNTDQLFLISSVLNLLLIVVSIIQLFTFKEVNSFPLETDNNAYISNAVNSKKIYVEILGQVVNPGVYLIDENVLVIELLNRAGGVTKFADMEYIHKNISLSKFLVNNQKIYIPSNKDGENTTTENSIININNSSKSEIETLPGIGEITAQKIIDNRPYVELVDLVNRKIISETIYNKIVTFVTL
jgi:competence protein ComEA